MTAIATALVSLVALLHVSFLVLEMFLWQTPFGMKTFGTTPEVAASSAVLAANQGLYGGATANARILSVQALPAALALAAVWSARPSGERH